MFVGNDSKLLVNEVAHKDDLSTTRNWLLVFKYFFLAIGAFVLLGTLAWLGVVITIVLTVPEQAPRGADIWVILAIGIVVTLFACSWLWLVSKLFRVSIAMLQPWKLVLGTSDWVYSRMSDLSADSEQEMQRCDVYAIHNVGLTRDRCLYAETPEGRLTISGPLPIPIAQKLPQLLRECIGM